ncbi:CG9922-like protein [Phlyctochytrium arcticum]|nr:CG9922-like protein [Phlyctochytrium arcticum]
MSKAAPLTTTIPAASDEPNPPSAGTPADETDEQNEESQKGFKGEAAKDMQNVSGYYDEKSGENVDEGKLDKAMTFLTDVSKEQKAQKSEREKELARVAVAKEDIDLVVQEFEISRAAADRALRENGANVLETMRTLVNA